MFDQLVSDIVVRQFERRVTPELLLAAEEGVWPEELWQEIVGLGLTSALLPEDKGGAGFTPSQALELVRLAGAFGVPLPIGETMFAAWLADRAGLGWPSGPLALHSGGALSLEREGSRYRLRGRAERLPWGRRAEAMLGFADLDGVAMLVVVPLAGLEVVHGSNLAGEPRDSLKLNLPLSSDSVAPTPDNTGRLTLRAIGAALRVGSMAGAMERALEMTVAYANQRVQFGKPIGRQQAIQQALAVMAGQVAAARAAADLAGGAIAADKPVDLVTIAAAKARAGEAAGICASIAHQTHGAIGFTREYHLHFLTKRLWSWRDEFGRDAEWSFWIGDMLLDRGADAFWPSMTALSDDSGQAALRRDVRAFLTEALCDATGFDRARSWMGFDAEFSRRLAEKGWLGMTLPRRLGGHERSPLERHIILEELLAAGAPVAAHWIADRQSAPLLLRFGTEAQHDKIVPTVAAGGCYFCIGMSEPDSGSDLAAVRTRAIKVEGGWRISGTKLWTTYAHRSHFMILFCRTGEAGAASGDRHADMSQFLVDLSTRGVSVRPIIDLAGEHHFNEVVFDNVFLPDDALIGEPGQGWTQVMSELALERSGPERFLSSMTLLIELIRVLGPAPGERAAVAIGRLAAHLIVLRRLSFDVARLLEKGENPGQQAALVKDLGALFEQEIPEIARDLVDIEPSLDGDDGFAAVLGRTMVSAPSFSLRGGTREILRSIIARGLGLR